MTNNEYRKLIEIGDEFWVEFSDIVAKHIAKMPEKLEYETIIYLQEKCHIYSSFYSGIIEKYRNKDNDNCTNDSNKRE